MSKNIAQLQKSLLLISPSSFLLPPQNQAKTKQTKKKKWDKNPNPILLQPTTTAAANSCHHPPQASPILPPSNAPHRNFHRKISPSTASPDEKEFDAKGDTFGPHERPSARKRFRTKFSAEQKERMRRLSERLGWRLQKRDESLVEDCCREIGVGREVLKVWMHNNNKNQMFGGLRRGEEESDVVGEAELNGVN